MSTLFDPSKFKIYKNTLIFNNFHFDRTKLTWFVQSKLGLNEVKFNIKILLLYICLLCLNHVYFVRMLTLFTTYIKHFVVHLKLLSHVIWSDCNCITTVTNEN